MPDNREERCDFMNIVCAYKGSFVPCVGADMDVNYVNGLSMVTLSQEEFDAIYVAGRDFAIACNRKTEATERLNHAMTAAIDAKFIEWKDDTT
jgi:hypothetical protein